MNPQVNISQGEDTDYDIFAAVRPGNISVDDNTEYDSMNEQFEEKDPFVSVRPTEESIKQGKKDRYRRENPTL